MGGMQRIGWIGVGKMGQPMVRRLLAKQHRVAVFDRDLRNMEAVIPDGAEPAGSVSELLGKADIIMSMIPNDDVLRALVFGPGGLAGRLTAGQIFVDLSTVSPSVSREVAEGIGTRRYLRAPVSGSTQTAEAGALTIVASGSERDFDECCPPFEAFSSKQYHVGKSEEARYLKLVLNSLVAANASLLADALKLGKAGGLGRKTMMEIICDSAVASPLLQYKRDSVVQGHYPSAFSVSQMIKDTGLIADAAAEAGVNMPINALSLQRFRDAAGRGLGDEDFFVITSGQAG